MPNFKEELKNVTITEEDRKNLTPEELARLEALLKKLREGEFPAVEFVDPERFDAKDMHPVGKGPVDWKKKR